MVKNNKESDKKYKAKTRASKIEFYSIVGDKCFFCSSKKLLACHKKDLSKHIPIANLSINQLSSENPNDYVRVCFKCHYGIHWCQKYFAITWDEVLSKIK